MPKTIYVALPVKNLSASTRFYETVLGCKKVQQFSDDSTSTLTWSDTISFQLHTREKFATYTPRRPADAKEATGALFTLSADDRKEVDKMVKAAGAAGGKAGSRAPVDLGWLYNRSFEDPDGHAFEAVWLDMKAASAAMPASPQAKPK